jgi:hypothetical protein
MVTASTAFAQTGTAVIGVGQMESSIAGADPASFQTMIETQLVKTNKFKIIERSRLAEILKEKGLNAMGLTTGGNPLSGIEGVDYLVYGSITKLGKSSSGTSVAGVSFGGGSVEMAVDLRVIDAHTGEIVRADTVGEQAKAGGTFSGAGLGGFGKKAADPLADVQRLTAQSITALITTTIYPIKVIAKQADGTYVVNYGDSILTEGDVLKIFKLGESFKDPDTGKVLGSEETEIGVLRVKEATGTFSKATLVSGEAEVGNQARRLSTNDAAKAPVDKRNGAKLP